MSSVAAILMNGPINLLEFYFHRQSKLKHRFSYPTPEKNKPATASSCNHVISLYAKNPVEYWTSLMSHTEKHVLG